MHICNTIKIRISIKETNDEQYRPHFVTFYKKKGTVCQLLINWPLSKGYFGFKTTL